MLTIIILVVFAIFTLGAVAWYYFKFCNKIAAINSDIEKAVKWLKNLPDGDNSERFHEIDAELQKNKSIGIIWQDFSKALTRYSDENGEQTVYAITEATDYFSFHRFTQNLNMSFWQNYGGIFTGLGILGTFAGLTFGLYGIDMSSSDIEVLKKGISGLLEGVQFAFLTSLIGIFTALIYNFIHDRQIKNLKGNIQSFSDEIENLFGRYTAEQWLAKQYTESQGQTKILSNLSEDVANDLGDLLNEQLNSGINELCERLEEKMTPIFDKLSDSINELGNNSVESIGQLVSEKAGKQIDQFANNLQALQQAMKQNIESSQQVASEMNQQMLAVVEKISDTMIAGAKNSVEKQESIMSSAQNQIENMLKTVAESSDNAIKNQNDAVKDMQMQMVKLMKAVNTSSENSVKNISDANNAIYQRMGQTLSNIQESIAQNIASSRETSENIIKQTREVMDNVNSTLILGANEAADKQQETANIIQNQMKETIEMVKNIAQNTAQSLNNMINAHNDSLKSTFERMRDFSTQTENMLKLVKDSSQAIKNAAEPLNTATSELKQQIELNRKDNKELRDSITAQMDAINKANADITQNLRTLMDGIKGQNQELKEAWEKYGKSYNNISVELEKSTNIVTERLGDYNNMMNEGMKETLANFDKSVNNAAGALKSVVEELQEIVDSLSQNS